MRRPSDGLIDSEQADAAGQPFKVDGDDPALDQRRRQVEVAGQLVKLNLLRVQLERIQARYLERDLAREILLGDVDVTLSMLRSAPARYAARFAAALGIEEDLAREVLERLIGSGLEDLGDLRTDAAQAINRA